LSGNSTRVEAPIPSPGVNRQNRETGARDSVERLAAAACRKYHEHVVLPNRFVVRRAALASFVSEFYRNRLKVLPSSDLQRALKELTAPDTLAVEVAHDGQLPHLGIVRMVLKADEIARADGQAVVLYLVGNHYTPEMRPDNLHYGMPLKGRPPNALKHPPRIRVGRANVHTPFRLLPPPSQAGLEELHRQLTEYVAHNVGHERRAGHNVSEAEEPRLLDRLRGQFDLLRRIASEVSSFGDWLIRVQYELLRELLGEDKDRVLLLPMAETTSLLREDLTALAGRDLAKGSFWLYCPSCHRRHRVAWSPGIALKFSCSHCGHRADIGEEEVWDWLMPDIVAYEAALFRLGIDGWVVGSHADYHPQIDRLYGESFGLEMPPKFFLTSVPKFRGIGDAQEGFSRTRLLRALLEVPPAELARALSIPWVEHPAIVSDMLGPAKSLPS